MGWERGKPHGERNQKKILFANRVNRMDTRQWNNVRNVIQEYNILRWWIPSVKIKASCLRWPTRKLIRKNSCGQNDHNEIPALVANNNHNNIFHVFVRNGGHVRNTNAIVLPNATRIVGWYVPTMMRAFYNSILPIDQHRKRCTHETRVQRIIHWAN